MAQDKGGVVGSLARRFLGRWLAGKETATLVDPSREPVAFDQAKFDYTATYLDPMAVTLYFSAIVPLAEKLRLDLRRENAIVANGTALADAAHSLAGSVGVFGFTRVAALSASFERAVKSGLTAEAAALGDRLASALDAALLEIARMHLD